jgi:uncharacterized protein YecE (DUF72 family)
VALCWADTDELCTPLEVTAPFGYLRLRKTRYSSRALGEWAHKIATQNWDSAWIFFMHEDSASGPRYATSLARLLAGTVRQPLEDARQIRLE